ncbi:LptF/LptG family permease [uncultured Victivallis sp.]|uniref:LptF/LptG family permease n=1 Tax=Victivallis sp. TaxID=2049020 RepID=UPI0025E57F04|nr:LptF/LptG family permease [uncultured Victivallis sp.]
MDKKEHLQYEDLTLLPRRWFPLPKLDGYILREFLIKYSVLLLVFIILFILSDVYRDISDFFEADAPWRSILLYLAYKLPGNVRFILPITMLLGCMWTMATFGKNMEVTAMRASGVSLFRCGGAIFAVGLVVTGVNIYFNEALVPYTERQAERVHDAVVDRRKSVQNLLAFRSSDQQRHWLFKTFTAGSAQENVTVKTFWTDGMIRSIILDLPEPEQKAMIEHIFRFKAAHLLGLSREARVREITSELKGRKVDFFANRVTFDPESGVWTFENGNFLSYDKNDETEYAASRGTSTMHDPRNYQAIRFSAEEIPETPTDIINAIKEKDELPTLVIWDYVHRNPNLAERVKSIYMTVFYYRLAFPWACFLAVFLGIPLATKNERTGSLMAIITAVALIVVYIVVAQVFLVLGKGGILNPMFAGLAPTIGFILCGAARIYYDRN